MPTYKLSYFNARGKAEVARYMFAMNDTEYEDHRIEGNWATEWKNKMPFGAMPVLQVDEVQICQSSALERYLAKKFGLYPTDDVAQARADMIVGCGDDLLQALMKARMGGGDADEAKAAATEKFGKEELPTMLANLEKMVDGPFFLGKTMMWPDVSIGHLISFFDVMKIEVDYAKYPKLKNIRTELEAHPKVAAWIKKRPESSF